MSEEDVTYDVSQDERGWFTVTARHPGTEFVGWAYRKTEDEARDKARLRLRGDAQGWFR